MPLPTLRKSVRIRRAYWRRIARRRLRCRYSASSPPRRVLLERLGRGEIRGRPGRRACGFGWCARDDVQMRLCLPVSGGLRIIGHRADRIGTNTVRTRRGQPRQHAGSHQPPCGAGLEKRTGRGRAADHLVVCIGRSFGRRAADAPAGLSYSASSEGFAFSRPKFCTPICSCSSSWVSRKSIWPSSSEISSSKRFLLT